MSEDEPRPPKTKIVTNRGKKFVARTDAQAYRGARERRAAGLPPAEPTTTTKPPYCGALIRAGNARYVEGEQRTCVLKAGHGTDHLGEGRCKYHGGASNIKHGRYSRVKRTNLREAIHRFSDDEDPMDLLPEVYFLRAVAEDYVERYDSLAEALVRWNAEEQSEADDQRRRPTILSIPDISDVGELLEKISRVVERVHKMKQRGAVTLETLQKIIEQFGLAVAKHVKDPKALSAIERDWADIKVD